MASAVLPTVRIAEADVQIVEYRGERVVTFEQVDTVHGRPEGTAKRNFHDNRTRFVQGEDFLELSRNEIRTEIPDGVFASKAPRGFLITHRGYLKLVKCLNDDVAWTVFGQMVDRYFEEPAPVAVANAMADPREVRLAMNQSLRLAKMAGLEGVYALHAASAQTYRLTGHDTLKTMGIARLAAPNDEKPLIPTQIGVRLGGLSAQVVNKLLEAHGFQDRDERGDWQATEKGKAAGARVVLTTRQHVEGPAYQLLWPTAIVAVLRPLLPPDGKVLAFPS
ncbi:ORF6N domain-containing protein [Aureimonas mangrovi]|uniref:ORF6N domain-containing protein n=1 Tax=Aureimonas mangrovi TaxID=2758041 RepID=UPI00163D82AB|nr:ORF6N domain-containing protein [Aureimonas mangrovi]